MATTGALSNEVPVDIVVADVNDHDPAFSQPLYTGTVKEDIPIGQRILQGKELIFRIIRKMFTL